MSVVDFEILDLMGQVIYEGQLSESMLVRTDWMLPGLYFIRFKRSGIVEVRCVIK